MEVELIQFALAIHSRPINMSPYILLMKVLISPLDDTYPQDPLRSGIPADQDQVTLVPRYIVHTFSRSRNTKPTSYLQPDNPVIEAIEHSLFSSCKVPRLALGVWPVLPILPDFLSLSVSPSRSLFTLKHSLMTLMTFVELKPTLYSLLNHLDRQLPTEYSLEV